MDWETTYLRYSAALHEVPRPAAFLDVEAFQANLQLVLQYARAMPLRLATKSIRCVPLLQEVLSTSSQFRGLMPFSAREALYLAQQGLDDFLIGYPFIQPAEIQAYVELRKLGKRAIAMVDSLEQVEALHYALRGMGVTGLLCLDVDVSSDWGWLYFGVRRSPLRSEEDVLHLAQRIRRYERLSLVGMMAYEAQIAGVGDHRLGVKGRVLRYLKKRSWQEILRKRQCVFAALKGAGFTLEVLNGGGTGSLAWTVKDPSVNEVTVGSALFAPALFDHYRDVTFRPAAGFSVEITRRPARDIFTVHGGGYIASGAAGPDKLPRPWLPPQARLLPHEGAGEVQTPVYIPNPPDFLKPGQTLYLRHAKAGELTQRFPILYLIQHDRLLGTHLTYGALPHSWV